MNDAPREASDFETGCISHTGKVRKANEDNFILRPEVGLWAVADGMGGHENGALASATVVAALEGVGAARSAADLLAMLEDSVLKANETLREEIRRRGATMGATLVVLLVHQRHFACVWSGDSRIYLVRSGQITQVSRDHTEVQDMVDRGVMTPDEAKRSPRRHVITHAIGVHEMPELDIESGEIADGDVFILCSDGLTEHVADTEILAASIRTPAHVRDAAIAGADCATIPTDVFKALFKHPLTERGLEQFMSDWAKTGQSIL